MIEAMAAQASSVRGGAAANCVAIHSSSVMGRPGDRSSAFPTPPRFPLVFTTEPIRGVTPDFLTAGTAGPASPRDFLTPR